jgi:hypothetical protein
VEIGALFKCYQLFKDFLNAFLVLVQQTKSESETESKNQGNINSQLNLTQKQHISTLN